MKNEELWQHLVENWAEYAEYDSEKLGALIRGLLSLFEEEARWRQFNETKTFCIHTLESGMDYAAMTETEVQHNLTIEAASKALKERVTWKRVREWHAEAEGSVPKWKI